MAHGALPHSSHCRADMVAMADITHKTHCGARLVPCSLSEVGRCDKVCTTGDAAMRQLGSAPADPSWLVCNPTFLHKSALKRLVAQRLAQVTGALPSCHHGSASSSLLHLLCERLKHKLQPLLGKCRAREVTLAGWCFRSNTGFFLQDRI